MTKYIQLTQGKQAAVDDTDYEWLNQWKWQATPASYPGEWYARRAARYNGKNVSLLMHRFILGATRGSQVDHINANGLDNRRSNIRVVSNTQNQQNRRKRRNCSSLYKGVHMDKSRNRWRAEIKVNGKRISLSYGKNEIELAKVYDKAAIKYFGEFARLNFPAAATPSRRARAARGTR